MPVCFMFIASVDTEELRDSGIESLFFAWFVVAPLSLKHCSY